MKTPEWFRLFIPAGKESNGLSGQLDRTSPYHYPQPANGIETIGPDAVLETQKELVAKIRQLVGEPDSAFEARYMRPIENYAGYVHLLPASENHHHNAPGGLFHHGLEVGYEALLLSEETLKGGRELPVDRKEITQRWRTAVFLAGLLHDIGKPVSDVLVVDANGSCTWDPFTASVSEWARQNEVQAYRLVWSKKRHKRHERMGPLVIGQVVPRELQAWMGERGGEVLAHLMESIGNAAGAGNDIYPLVVKADQHSTSKDLERPRGANQSAATVALEQHVIRAMRRLLETEVWHPGQAGSPVWILDGTLFLIWPQAATDITNILKEDGTGGVPSEPDVLAEVLIERGMASMAGPTNIYARIRPDVLAKGRAEDFCLPALTMSPQLDIWPVFPDDASGRVLMSTIQKKDLSEPNPPSPQTELPPAPATNKEAIDLAPEIITPNGADNRTSNPQRSDASATRVPEANKTGKAWLKKQGLLGQVLLALAEDIRDGTKKEGVDWLEIKDGLAIHWPAAIKGYGAEIKDLLKGLNEKNWVVVDPYSPMRKTREVAGFAGKKTRKAVVIMPEVACHLLQVARYRSSTGSPARKEARDEQAEGPFEENAVSTAKQSLEPASHKPSRNPSAVTERPQQEQENIANEKSNKKPSEGDNLAEKLIVSTVGEDGVIRAKRVGKGLYICPQDLRAFSTTSGVSLARIRSQLKKAGINLIINNSDAEE